LRGFAELGFQRGQVAAAGEFAPRFVDDAVVAAQVRREFDRRGGYGFSFERLLDDRDRRGE